MQEYWSTSGLDLALALDGHGGRRVSLEQALREAIRLGTLVAGSRVPSTRALARDLGVARGTVAEAYAQLVAEGYLIARRGSHTEVAATPFLSAHATSAPPPRTAPSADFFPGIPDLSSFPRTAWLAALRRGLRDAPDVAFGYGGQQGYAPLRQQLAAYLGRTRGVRTNPDQIVICSGFLHGLSLTTMVLREAGITMMGMEDPCIPAHRTIVQRSGLEVLPIPVDDAGLQVERLPNVRMAQLLTPVHQYPFGVTLQAARRAAVVRWARVTGSVLIEDDYDGEFRYDRQPLGALQGLAPDQVVYAGTTSKTLAPGLRLGWLAAPPWLVEAIDAHKQQTDRHPGILEQLAFTELLATGQFDRHVRHMRLQYRRRRDRLTAALARAAPGLRPLGIAAGLHVTLALSDGSPSEAELLARAAERGVAFDVLGPYWHAPPGPRAGLVLGYATPPPHAFEAAVTRLCTVLAEQAG